MAERKGNEYMVLTKKQFFYHLFKWKEEGLFESFTTSEKRLETIINSVRPPEKHLPIEEIIFEIKKHKSSYASIIIYSTLPKESKFENQYAREKASDSVKIGILWYVKGSYYYKRTREPLRRIQTFYKNLKIAVEEALEETGRLVMYKTPEEQGFKKIGESKKKEEPANDVE